jgi:cytochrome c oxidase assembly factor 2
MPPVLHPRSRTTLSLFTTTLALSFVVVALPHMLPCPVPHRKRLYADGKSSEMDAQSRRRRKSQPQSQSEIDQRECPVPKPSGLVGKILGFKSNDREKPMAVKIVTKSNAS